MSIIQEMQFYADLATVGAFVGTIITFWIVRRGSKKSEQLSLVREILKEKKTLENEITKDDNSVFKDENKKEALKFRISQYMNIYEWFAFLVNNNEITDPKIKNYMKRPFLRDYAAMIKAMPELFNKDEDEIDTFNEVKILYEKWKDSKSD